MINGAVTYIDDLRYVSHLGIFMVVVLSGRLPQELPTEQTVLDVTNVVTNIKSPLDVSHLGMT